MASNYHMLTIMFYLTSADINTMEEAAHEFKFDVWLRFTRGLWVHIGSCFMQMGIAEQFDGFELLAIIAV